MQYRAVLIAIICWFACTSTVCVLKSTYRTCIVLHARRSLLVMGNIKHKQNVDMQGLLQKPCHFLAMFRVMLDKHAASTCSTSPVAVPQ